jgi:hypothetical protein
MQGHTPVELDLRAARAKAAGADPDAARYADAHRILDVAEVTPGMPFPNISRDRAVLFYVGIEDPDEAGQAIRDAREILGYALKAEFYPRQTVAYDVRHDILTATLQSGLKVDLVARAQYTGGQDAPQDAPELAAVAA